MEKATIFDRFVLLALFYLATIFGAEVKAQEDRLKPLIEGAKKEKTLQIYSIIVVSEHMQIISRFKEKYPFIDVQLWRSTSENILNRVLTEARANKHLVDIIGTGGRETHDLVSKGLLQKYNSPERKSYEPGFKDAEGYWTAFYVNPLVTAYNTRMVTDKEAPKTYDDFLDPKWKGKLVMEEDELEWFFTMLRHWGEDKGLNYMRRLGRQGFSVLKGHTAMMNLVAMGEYPGAVLLYAPQTEDTKSLGAPIEWNPLNPTVAIVNGMGIAAKAPHPNAARLYLDHMLSAEIQQDYLSGKFFKVSARKGVTSVIEQKLRRVKVIPSDVGQAGGIDKYSKIYKEIFLSR